MNRYLPLATNAAKPNQLATRQKALYACCAVFAIFAFLRVTGRFYVLGDGNWQHFGSRTWSPHLMRVRARLDAGLSQMAAEAGNPKDWQRNIWQSWRNAEDMLELRTSWTAMNPDFNYKVSSVQRTR